MKWTKERGLLGPMKPLLGTWLSEPAWQQTDRPMRCTRTFTAFGDGWIELAAHWDMGPGHDYRERAFFGARPDGSLGFYSFTNDANRSEGQLTDGSDVHPDAVTFEAQMQAGLARMIYWPLADEAGFNFAVDSRIQTGWNRFLRHTYRPVAASE